MKYTEISKQAYLEAWERVGKKHSDSQGKFTLSNRIDMPVGMVGSHGKYEHIELKFNNFKELKQMIRPAFGYNHILSGVVSFIHNNITMDVEVCDLDEVNGLLVLLAKIDEKTVHRLFDFNHISKVIDDVDKDGIDWSNVLEFIESKYHSNFESVSDFAKFERGDDNQDDSLDWELIGNKILEERNLQMIDGRIYDIS